METSRCGDQQVWRPASVESRCRREADVETSRYGDQQVWRPADVETSRCGDQHVWRTSRYGRPAGMDISRCLAGVKDQQVWRPARKPHMEDRRHLMLVYARFCQGPMLELSYKIVFYSMELCVNIQI